MADQVENTSSGIGKNYIKGMIKDLNDSSVPEGAWTHARNATPYSSQGDMTTLGNEPSNTQCLNQMVPFTIIGKIYKIDDQWIIFSTDPNDSTKNEIGIFNDSNCTYTPIISPQNNTINGVTVVDTSCLNFNVNHLITGAAKFNFDCTWSVYFADGLNPDRYFNLDDPSRFYQTVNEPVANDASCIVPVWVGAHGTVNAGTLGNPVLLDCDKMRIASLMQLPCISLELGHSGGNLLNGSYFVTGAYTVNGQVMSNYFPPTSIQPIFNHSNSAGSLIVNFSNLDTTYFTEFQLVVVSTINQQTTAKIFGIYDTTTNVVLIDYLDPTLVDLPISLLPLVSPEYEKSEAIFPIGSSIARIAPTTNFDFNYQPLANQIKIQWTCTEYPSTYYKTGGNNASYLRDEVYAFFIRWVYNTGAKSSSYHIPGRPANSTDLGTPPSDVLSSDGFPLITGGASGPKLGSTRQTWQVFNTAVNKTPPSPTPLGFTADGGKVIAIGDMGYWQSTEIYPDDEPERWNSFPGQSSPYNLCGSPIRHHKMPGNFFYDPTTGKPSNDPSVNHFKTDASGNSYIRLLGIQVSNIAFPTDLNGNPITNIVGYEILRSSREGNKTILAKGMINHTRNYALTTGASTTRQGIYPNYPYNPLGDDPTLQPTDPNPADNIPTNIVTQGKGVSSVNPYVYTFHSPDTQFRHPFLNAKELKLDGEISGQVSGSFTEVPNHPKAKLITDVSFFLAAMIGLGAAVESVVGKRSQSMTPPHSNTNGFVEIGLSSGDAGASQAANVPAIASYYGVIGGLDNIPGVATSSLVNAFSAATVGNDYSVNENARGAAVDGINAAIEAASLISLGVLSGYDPPGYQLNREQSKTDTLPPAIRIITGVMSMSTYWSLGTNDALDLIYALVPYEQYAYRYLSHGQYTNFNPGNIQPGTIRKSIQNANYLESQFQDFGSAYKVNNLYRNRSVILDLGFVANGNQVLPNPSVTDNTVTSMVNAKVGPNQNLLTTASSYYGALKIEMEGQYGQLSAFNIKEVPVSCVYPALPDSTGKYTPYSTDFLFGGDTYVCRYTEKNSFFYFYNWLQNQPDGYEFDYTKYYMLNFPKFYLNSTKFEANEFLQDIFNWFMTFGSASWYSAFPGSRHNLDNYGGVSNNSPGFNLNSITKALFSVFGIKDQAFYLFQSGVRDFFVESEINTDLRDWNDVDQDRFYDPYQFTDLPTLFDPKIIKSPELFKYDYSLSISKLFSNLISWGTLQDRDYNPQTSESCYVYYPYKLIYSLPQNEEQKKDYWRVFLVNNYQNFDDRITAIKAINKSGLIILFEEGSPLMFQGLDQLQTGLGTKLTIGDGGLFSQPGQQLVNVEDSLSYGSSQSRQSIINTPFGTYWMCVDQGKIFQFAGSLTDIGMTGGLKFWLKTFLPYALLNDFPNFPYTDNPVSGIGCQTIYDNQLELLYFCKKDYALLPQYQGLVTINLPVIKGQNVFFTLTTTGANYLLGDPAIFQDASWTLSYDPKEKTFISFHDWHPNLGLSSKNTIVTIVNNQFWVHNTSVSSFQNFYGINYPFEVEYVAASGVNVNTLRSIEYYMEAYKYDKNGYNKFHLLDYNFDTAVIYNTEQVSGVLHLNQTPKNDPYGTLLFPKIQSSWIDILYQKVEQRYRFNQFWDITADRGEYQQGGAYAQRYIWLWDPNGYTRSLNPVNLNYNKAPFQRKKFRHYLTSVVLSKFAGISNIPTNIKMIVKVTVDKLLNSKR